MFCTKGTVCYKQHEGNFSEVIYEDACIRDSTNVYVSCFPKVNFMTKTCRTILFNCIDIHTARLISRHQQPLSSFLLAFTITQYFYKQYFLLVSKYLLWNRFIIYRQILQMTVDFAKHALDTINTQVTSFVQDQPRNLKNKKGNCMYLCVFQFS